jgi:hypothetical protein
MTPMTPLAMLSHAVANGASLDIIERLTALMERWEASQNKKAFNNAVADSKLEIPVISRNCLVDFQHKDKQGRTTYRHEDFAEVARTVDPILGKYGLSYRFNVSSDVNLPISVTCILIHRDGHSEQTTLVGPRDTGVGMNPLQAIMSTITYLQRYTLKAMLGLAVGEDDDGRRGSDKDDPTDKKDTADEKVETITAAQARALHKLIDGLSLDKAEERFLKFMSETTKSTISSIEEIPASYYDAAKDVLARKAKK